MEEFPHNPFGRQLREMGLATQTNGHPADLSSRLSAAADLDADRDGVPNEAELLLGHNPGNAADLPTSAELELLPGRQRDFKQFLTSYRWRPFQSVQRPAVPVASNPRWVRNPIDAFVAEARQTHGLGLRPEARRDVLLRRVYVDLIGLTPTPAEQQAFLADTSDGAYEKVVDRLLNDPRHGERWGRHWMDIWRYSDWAGWSDGNQIRDSKPHIWRWRDWIVESLNGDKGYDQMLIEMLAADELAPLDPDTLRATGFLVRNYKMLSREQWMEDTIKHTAQAFLGVTLGCAKCHDHMTDPISQVDYYRVRAIFEPHQVRTDRRPGELDVLKDGVVRAFDTKTNLLTRLFIRGDERHPDTNRVIEPGVPESLCGDTLLAHEHGRLNCDTVHLPRLAAEPDRREAVRRDVLAASARACQEAVTKLARARTNSPISSTNILEQEHLVAVAETKHRALHAVCEAERLEDTDQQATSAWKNAATAAVDAQRAVAVEEARVKLYRANVAVTAAREAVEQANVFAASSAAETDRLAARQTSSSNAPTTLNAGETAATKSKEAKTTAATAEKASKELEGAIQKQKEAEKSLAAAERALQSPASTAYTPRTVESYPQTSSGRRLAFARWLADSRNPLTARVAVNHVWMRHFGRGLVTTPTDFGFAGRPPSHPQLLDWLAAELMERGWSMKALHRLMVTSSTYRMASTPDSQDEARDPDNIWLWRMPSRRLEAEVIRDNLLYVAGDLDLSMGGPDIDHNLGLTSRRRSLYLRLAAEKEVEFLRIFDGPTVTECYERRPTVMPQQALALGNSEIALRQAEHLAALLDREALASDDFISRAYLQLLARRPKADELTLCREFLAATAGTTVARRRQNLILVLMNHNDFVTVR